MPTLATKEEYDKFKYVNVSIRAIGVASGGTAPSVRVDKVKENTIVPEIILEKKGKGGGGGGGGFKFPPIKLPKFNFFKTGTIYSYQDLCGGF